MPVLRGYRASRLTGCNLWLGASLAGCASVRMSLAEIRKVRARRSLCAYVVGDRQVPYCLGSVVLPVVLLGLSVGLWPAVAQASEAGAAGGFPRSRAAPRRGSFRDARPRYGTDGLWIIDAERRRLIWRGPDVSGAEFTPSADPLPFGPDDFAAIRATGATVVRIPIAWAWVEPTEVATTRRCWRGSIRSCPGRGGLGCDSEDWPQDWNAALAVATPRSTSLRSASSTSA
jgi:hypothetical protein